MLERFLFAVIPLVSTPAAAAPVEEYSRLQTQFVNQLKETSTGIALPAQDFKRKVRFVMKVSVWLPLSDL